MMRSGSQDMWRRLGPRVPVQAFCSQHDDRAERHALIVDVSEDGLRVQRPPGGPSRRTVQLEFEVPGVDEIAWAQGEIRFDEVWRVDPGPDGGLSGIVRTSGIRLVAAAERHRRMLREYVRDTWAQLSRVGAVGPWRRPDSASDPDASASTLLAHAACYLRG